MFENTNVFIIVCKTHIFTYNQAQANCMLQEELKKYFGACILNATLILP